jgi:D-alanine-D-alanine ligase
MIRLALQLHTQQVKIALIFNGRPTAAAHIAHAPDDVNEEFDDPRTIAAIAAALSPFGDVVPLEADRTLARRLEEERFTFAFNIAEGYGRRCREAHAAAVCELLQIPFSHSDALTLALTLDKWLARRVVSPDVAVAPARLVCEELDTSALDLTFPVVVKPNDEGSSKGIRDDSVAVTRDDARRLIGRVRALYDCPVLVEEYLPGPEITVGILGNGAGSRVLGMMEIAPATAAPHFLYSVDAKRAFRQRVHYLIPPRLDADTCAELEASALRAYRLLGCRDVARLDFRLDAGGRPRFLECNPLPGLNPDTSDLVILSRPHRSHATLVQEIFDHALRRHAMVTA